MKKNLLVLLLIALILPSVALASWWNPFSWFKKLLKNNVEIMVPKPETEQNDSTGELNSNIITVIGNYTCLGRPRGGTKECFMGLEGEDGLRYRLSYPYKGSGNGNSRIKVVGIFEPNSDDYNNEMSKFNSKYNMVGIIDATSMEELPSINFIFKYGVHEQDILNTFDKTFTKHMIGDKGTTIKLELSTSELQNISKKITELNLFNIKPNIVLNTGVTMTSTPCSSYYLKTDIDSVQKEISWNDCSAEIKDEYKKFTDYVIKIIESKEEYKKLPEVKGGYM